jgi:DNA-binding NtrC family response regulator
MGESPDLPQSSDSNHDGNSADQLLDLTYKEARRRLLDDFERRYLEHLLRISDGNVAAASRRAGVDRTYLIKLLQRRDLR